MCRSLGFAIQLPPRSELTARGCFARIRGPGRRREKGKARVVTIGQMAQMLRQSQLDVANSVMERLPNILERVLGEHFGVFKRYVHMFFSSTAEMFYLELILDRSR